MASKQAVPSLPPTLSISDPSTRAFCEALANAWSVRNNGFGRDEERFVRKGEIGALAERAVLSTLSGAASMSDVSMQGGSSKAVYDSVLKAVEDLVLQSRAYAYLSTPIELIKPPTAQVRRINELVAKVDQEVADRIAAIEAEALLRGSGINSEQTSRITDVENLQSQIDTFIAVSGGDFSSVLAAIETERTARASGDLAEATARDTLAVQMRGGYTGHDASLLTQGLVYSERQARLTAVGVVAYSVDILQARVGDTEASIVTEYEARASADNAMASLITVLQARADGAEASIYSESSTRSSKDNAIAQAVNTIWASIGGSAALIQDGALAAVSPAAVTATKWQQVQAAVTDPNTGLVNSASIKSELIAYASSVDGTLNTTWGVKSNVDGVISGVTLMTTSGAGSAPGTATSQFMVMADRFSLVNPSNTALHPVPFSVDSGGNAVFAGHIYADAGTFGGSLAAATGTFSGALSAATGTFSGALSAATGTFSGALNAATGTFSGLLTADAINAVKTINVAGNSITVSGSASGVSPVVVLSVPSGQTMRITAIATTSPISYTGMGYAGLSFSLYITIQSSTGSFSQIGTGYTDESGTTPISYTIFPALTGQHYHEVTGPATVYVSASYTGGETIRLAAFGSMK